jgi:hypothetical protein
VLADEKRRVAAPRFADARNPPTGRERRERRAQELGAESSHERPRKPTASTSMIAVISDVAAAVSGTRLVVETRTAARAGEREQPADEAAGAQQPRLDRGVAERDRRPHAGGASPAARTASSATATPPAMALRPASSRRRR